MELIHSKDFTVCFGPSHSPDIPIFLRFRSVWQVLEKENIVLLNIKPEAREFVPPVIQSLKYAHQKNYCRDDYKELIELTLILLGNKPEEIHWRIPGAVHRARWMGKLLYTMKMYLFREQKDVFSLSKKETVQLERFVHFGAIIYTKVWTEAPFAADAPNGDLQLWSNLEKYQEVDKEISDAAKKVLKNHLWYLSDELVGLSLFSDKISAAEKCLIVAGMTRESSEQRMVRGDSRLLMKDDVHLGDFASTRTVQLLNRLQIDNSFLSEDPEKWSDITEYQQGQQRVHSLHVVNDAAERGVKLFQDFNLLLSKDEQEKQLILQVVENNRRKVPTETTKQAAISALVQ